LKNTNPKKKSNKAKVANAQAKNDSELEVDPSKLLEGLNPLQLKQMGVLMNTVKEKGGLVTEAGEKESEEEEAGGKQASAPDKGQVAPNSKKKEVSKADQLLNLCLTGKAKKAKKGMENLIREVVRSHLYRILKIIPNKTVQDIAVKKVRIWLNISALQGNDCDTERRIQEFDETYGPVVTKLLNEHRSYVSSQIKEVMHKNWLKHEQSLPSRDQLMRLIGRDFELHGEKKVLDEEDYTLLKWWITELLPKACGIQSEWGPEHHFYMTVQKGAPAKRPNRHYVTSTTEAFAVWVIENNRENWPAQWNAKTEHGNYGIIRKTKGPNEETLTDETSVVSVLNFVQFAPNLVDFLPY